MSHHVDPTDVGKAVIDANGERVATVKFVHDGTVFVRRASELDPVLSAAMGWHSGAEPHTLPALAIASVDGSAVYLRSNL